MNGADGAYASSTQNIYLSNALFKSGAAPVDSVFGVAGVLVEETFHWLDDRVGTDTQGDEGEFAKDLLFGVNLSNTELTRIKQEDDRGVITVNDQSVFVEQARIDGNNSNNILSGTNSDDVIYGYNGNDDIYANNGNDSVYGGGNDDRLWGGNGNDRLWGGNGNDRLWGGNGNDRLWGENGNDTLNGYGFSDNERDTLIGGTGADRFVLGDASSVFYSKNGNSDYAVIADFNRFEGDVISLKKLAFNNSSGVRAYGYRLAQVGANTEIRVDNTNELVAVLQNRTGVNLSQGFAFEGTPKRVENDFNGDGQSDILWRNQNGLVHAWLMNGTTVQGRVNLESPGLDWQIQGTGDFNRDGQTDILWRHQNGLVHTWLMNGTTVQGRVNLESPGLDWQIQAQSGYSRDLGNLSDEQWDEQSGDNNRFEQNPLGGGGDQRGKTNDRIEQIYTDLATSIFGSRRAMNTGYAFDTSYLSIGVGYHSGIDIAATTGKDDVRAVFRGVVVKSYNDRGNGHWMAIDELDALGNKTGRRWWYGHMQEPANGVSSWIGKTIEAGTVLAKAGMGHLHLAVQNVAGSIGNGTSAKDVQNRSMSPLQAYWKAKNGIKESVIWNK